MQRFLFIQHAIIGAVFRQQGLVIQGDGHSFAFRTVRNEQLVLPEQPLSFFLVSQSVAEQQTRLASGRVRAVSGFPALTLCATLSAQSGRKSRLSILRQRGFLWPRSMTLVILWSLKFRNLFRVIAGDIKLIVQLIKSYP